MIKNMETEVIRPWGTYKVIFKGKAFQIKKIVVNPHSKLSLQSHEQRSEHWIIVEGTGIVTLDDETITLNKEEHIFIPVKSKHRMENNTEKEVIFVEVQNGSYLGEDDIVRYEDIYGRK
jgi:mannose-6-phosphate isomerase-like protein (cupin superfamily)